MNSKLTFGELVSLLALRSGFSRRVCEDFLKSLFSTVTSALESGENVRVKGFGSFKITEIGARKSVNVTTGEDYEIPPHRRVTFIPAKELAAAVNLPFEAFEAVEVSDEVTDEELEEAANLPAQAATADEPKEETVEETAEETAEDGSDAEADSPEEYDLEQEKEAELTECAHEPEMEIVVETRVKASAHEVTAPTAVSVATTSAPKPVEQEEPEAAPYATPKRRGGFRIWEFAAGAVCGAVLAMVGFALASHHGVVSLPTEITEAAAAQTEDETVLTAETVSEEEALRQQPDTIRPVEKEEKNAQTTVATTASDAPVYDTISTTRYLTTMAKEHYGNYNLWPYIYEENKAILGHPDRIRPGTQVVVPPLSKYGVNPSNPDDIAKAKRMGVAIYARYK